MASEIPLNLYHCNFDIDDNWQYSQESLKIAVNKLQELWTEHSIKTSMIKYMLDDLSKITNNLDESLSSFLLNGVKPKCYVPLMQRKRCGMYFVQF